MLLEEDGREAPYVVKLFAPHHIEQQHAVAKEIWCNVIAEQFGLNVPNIALTCFDEYFVAEIMNDEQRNIYASKHGGWLFASRLESGLVPYSQAIHRNFLRNEDYANIYAFDALIYNIDRGKNPLKPNLLVEDDNYLLIDHEQSFPFIDNRTTFFQIILDKLSNYELDYRYERHLFYPLLKGLRPRNKELLFKEFKEGLTNLDIGQIEDLTDRLNSLNISTGNYDILIEYLYRLKRDADLFIKCLAISIS